MSGFARARRGAVFGQGLGLLPSQGEQPEQPEQQGAGRRGVRPRMEDAARSAQGAAQNVPAQVRPLALRVSHAAARVDGDAARGARAERRLVGARHIRLQLGQGVSQKVRRARPRRRVAGQGGRRAAAHGRRAQPAARQPRGERRDAGVGQGPLPGHSNGGPVVPRHHGARGAVAPVTASGCRRRRWRRRRRRRGGGGPLHERRHVGARQQQRRGELPRAQAATCAHADRRRRGRASDARVQPRRAHALCGCRGGAQSRVRVARAAARGARRPPLLPDVPAEPNAHATGRWGHGGLGAADLQVRVAAHAPRLQGGRRCRAESAAAAQALRHDRARVRQRREPRGAPALLAHPDERVLRRPRGRAARVLLRSGGPREPPAV